MNLTTIHLSRGAFCAGVLAFAMPFASVSCAGQTVAQVRGIEFITGSNAPGGQTASGKAATPGEIPWEKPLAAGACVLGVIALLSSFSRSGGKHAAGIAGLAAGGAVLAFATRGGPSNATAGVTRPANIPFAVPVAEAAHSGNSTTSQP